MVCVNTLTLQTGDGTDREFPRRSPSISTMRALPKTSFASPLLLSLFAVMACAPGGPDDDDSVLALPTPTGLAPADIGPVPDPGPWEIVFQPSQITVGKWHACTLLLDGKLACWGSNANGKLGIGTTAGAYRKPQRSQSALTDLHLISAGEDHTCVVRGENRLVSCWGRNSYGATNPVQADGSPPSSGCPLNVGCSTPSTVPHVSNARYLAAGYDHTCAYGIGGVEGSSHPGMICWGRASTNLLGAGGGGGWPVRTNYPSIDAVDAGEKFTCTHVNWPDDKVWCFGRFPGANGQWNDTAGVGINIASSLPDFRTLSVGESHVCLIDGSSVLCQGESLSGQAGVVKTPSDPHVTSLESVVSGATAVAAGARHTCAIISGGRVKCWGANDKGQLGVGETFSMSAAPLIAALPTSQVARTIAAGGDTTCVITDSRRLYCWGSNNYGQVGADSSEDVIATPTRVTW
jgi:hypothetical protein